MLLFLMASGLTVIFSMMGVLNFAHASFYMLGAFFGFEFGLHLASGPACCWRRCWSAASAWRWSVTGCAGFTGTATSPSFCSPSA